MYLYSRRCMYCWGGVLTEYSPGQLIVSLPKAGVYGVQVAAQLQEAAAGVLSTQVLVVVVAAAAIRWMLHLLLAFCCKYCVSCLCLLKVR